MFPSYAYSIALDEYALKAHSDNQNDLVVIFCALLGIWKMLSTISMKMLTYYCPTDICCVRMLCKPLCTTFWHNICWAKCCSSHLDQHFGTTSCVCTTFSTDVGDFGRCCSRCCSKHLEQHFHTTNVEWKSISHNICCADWNRMLIQTHSTFVHQVTQHMLCQNAPNVVQSSFAQHFGTTYVDPFVDRIFSKG